MLVDNINLIVKAGNGGDGAATFLHNEGKFKGGPDGGNGGNYRTPNRTPTFQVGKLKHGSDSLYKTRK